MNQQQNKNDENIGSFYIGRRPPDTPERVLPKGGLTVVALLAFAAIIWYAYPEGEEKYADMDVPVVVAQKDAYKFTPDDPGGMEVRHQDSTVFDPLEKKSTKTVEKLMPTPEEPVDKAEVLKADTTAQLEPKLDMQIEKLDTGAEKIVAKAETAKSQMAETVAKPVAKPVAEKTAAAQADDAKPAKDVAEKPAEKTASLATAAKAETGGQMVYIQLGSYRNTAGASEDWSRLKKKHPALLGSLEMRTQRVDLGSKGVFNRLQAGKVSETKAKEICETLKTSNPGGCLVVR